MFAILTMDGPQSLVDAVGKEVIDQRAERAHGGFMREVGFAAGLIRSRQETVTFKHPFQIRGIDRVCPRRLRSDHRRG
jgi:hypothetical protein